MPYTSAELKLLETSVLNWLKSLGILQKLMNVSSVSDIQNMIDIQRYASNGTLLCEVVSTIFNIKIPGVFRDPKTETTCL